MMAQIVEGEGSHSTISSSGVIVDVVCAFNLPDCVAAKVMAAIKATRKILLFISVCFLLGF